jgi:Protein of unknown function (DUF2842)
LRQDGNRRWLALEIRRAYGSIMNIRMRKLVGTVATLIFLIVYCLIAMVIGNTVLTRFTFAGQALYFIAAGLAWLPIAMILVRWMQRPDDA